MSDQSVTLRPGHFYRSRDGEIWCCFRVRTEQGSATQCDCVRVSDRRLEYFYIDGRYDIKGDREHTLVREV
jgi:hypothetical protein